MSRASERLLQLAAECRDVARQKTLEAESYERSAAALNGHAKAQAEADIDTKLAKAGALRGDIWAEPSTVPPIGRHARYEARLNVLRELMQPDTPYTIKGLIEQLQRRGLGSDHTTISKNLHTIGAHCV